MKKFLILLVFAYTSIGHAYTPGGSNLDYRGYPGFDEFQPQEPFSRSRYDYEIYKSEVELYIDKAKEYIENGDNDIQRIRKKQKDAAEKAQEAIDRFNQWVNGR